MGYRSNVVLAMTASAHRKMMDEIASLDDANLREKVEEFLREYAEISEEDGIVFLRWNDVKWYYWGDLPAEAEEVLSFGDRYRYADVRFMVKFLEKLNKHEYKFVRRGEGRGDTERKGSLKVEKEKMR